MTVKGGGRVEDGGIEQEGKRTHGYRQQCGICGGGGGMRKLHSNGKSCNKDKSMKNKQINYKMCI